MIGVDRGYVALPHILLRADAKEKDVIYLEASNTKKDEQQEVVLKAALEDEADNYLKKGVLSWDHMHKLKNDPNYIIGEPLDVRFNDEGTTLVKGRVYLDNHYAQGVMSMAKSGSTRLGASIGGFIVKRTKVMVGEMKKSINAIAKILWDEVALTHRAVNEATTVAGGGSGVSVMPFPEFAKAFGAMDNDERLQLRDEIQKALMAGYGTDAATMTGGRALTPESLRGAKRRKKKNKMLTRAFVDVLQDIRRGRIETYADLERVLRSRGAEEDAAQVATLVVDNTQKLQAMFSRRNT
jgi:hypothetical protein